MLKKIISKSVHFIGKTYIILALIIIIAVFSMKFLLVGEKWGQEARPYTDSFLLLLKDAEYQELYSQFVGADSISFLEFKDNVIKINNIFGVINSFDYKGAYYSTEGSEKTLTGCYIKYRIKFESGRTVIGYFTLMIDSENNCPVPSKIETFVIEGDIEKGEVFFLRL